MCWKDWTLLPRMSQLTTDVFGNYVIQKFFEHLVTSCEEKVYIYIGSGAQVTAIAGLPHTKLIQALRGVAEEVALCAGLFLRNGHWLQKDE